MEAYYTWLDQARQKSGGPNTVKAYKTNFKQFFSTQVDAAGQIIWQPVAPWEVTPRLALQYAAFLVQAGRAVYAGGRNRQPHLLLQNVQELGLSPGQLAEAAGVGREQIDRFLAGDRPSESLCLALAGLTGLDYTQVMQRAGHWPIDRQPLTQASVNQKMAALSSFFTFVQKNYDLIPANRRNPFSAVERGKIDVYSRAKYPTFEEAQQILKAVNTDCLQGRRDFALLYTILTTCRRSSEILNLKWGDIQQEGQNGQKVFTYRYKGGKIKKANLGPLAYQSIVAYLKADGRLAVIGPDDFIFIPIDEERIHRLQPDLPVEINRPISNSMANRILKKYARRAGVDAAKAHIHGLRHAGARQRVREMKQGKGHIDLEQIMTLLGHSSLAVTQIYTAAVLDDPDDQGIHAAERAFMPAGKKRRQKQPPAAQQQQLL
jgi:integrase/recombinase XerD